MAFPSSFIPGSPCRHWLCDCLVAGSSLELMWVYLKPIQGVLALISRIREHDLWAKENLQGPGRVWGWRWPWVLWATARVLPRGRQEVRGDVRMGTHVRERLEEASFEDRGGVPQPGDAGRLKKLEKAANSFSPQPTPLRRPTALPPSLDLISRTVRS